MTYQPVSPPRLIVEAVITTLLIIGAAQLTWVPLPWFEHRR